MSDWNPQITWREFTEQYAANCNMTVREFADRWGPYCVIAPCACGYEGCQGWGKTYRESLSDPMNAWMKPEDIHEIAEALL